MSTNRRLRRANAPETGFYEVRVTDDHDIGLEEAVVDFAAPDRTERVITDRDGIARLSGSVDGWASVRADPEAIRIAIEARWRTRRLPVGVVPPDPGEELRQPASSSVWTPIRANKRYTLRLRSFFRLLDLPGEAFDADSAFPLTAAFPRLTTIREAVLAGGDRRVMVFAHADERTGEAANKTLAERRGQAIFGLLAHRPDVWEELWKSERWGMKPQIVSAMLTAVGIRDSGQFLRPAIAAFQASRPPLVANGEIGPDTRSALFLAYFKSAGAQPLPEALFLKTPAATSPWMGCGELNPASPSTGEASNRRVEFLIGHEASLPSPPCQIGNLGPCQAACAMTPSTRDKDDPRLKDFRCAAYRGFARKALETAGEGASSGASEVSIEMRSARTQQPLPHTDFSLEAYTEAGGYAPVAHGRTDGHARAIIATTGPGPFRVKALFRRLPPIEPVRASPTTLPAGWSAPKSDSSHAELTFAETSRIPVGRRAAPAEVEPSAPPPAPPSEQPVPDDGEVVGESSSVLFAPPIPPPTPLDDSSATVTLGARDDFPEPPEIPQAPAALPGERMRSFSPPPERERTPAPFPALRERAPAASPLDATPPPRRGTPSEAAPSTRGGTPPAMPANRGGTPPATPPGREATPLPTPVAREGRPPATLSDRGGTPGRERTPPPMRGVREGNPALSDRDDMPPEPPSDLDENPRATTSDRKEPPSDRTRTPRAASALGDLLPALPFEPFMAPPPEDDDDSTGPPADFEEVTPEKFPRRGWNATPPAPPPRKETPPGRPVPPPTPDPDETPAKFRRREGAPPAKKKPGLLADAAPADDSQRMNPPPLFEPPPGHDADDEHGSD